MQSDKPRVSSPFVNDTGVEFYGLRNSEAKPEMIEDRSAQRSVQPVAQESDMAAFCSISDEKCVHGATDAPRRRSRIKPPIIEVVYVPTKFDSYDEKVIYGILADWILAGIEKEMKEKNDRYKPFSSRM